MNRVDRLSQPAPTKGEARRAKELNRVLDRLPESGAVMVVGSHSVAPVIRRLIIERRGAAVGAATRVIIAASARDEDLATKHLSVPVFRDPFVADMREHAGALTQSWRF